MRGNPLAYAATEFFMVFCLARLLKCVVVLGCAVGKEEEVRGERTEETNASTLVRVTSHVTISPKIHCEQTQM